MVVVYAVMQWTKMFGESKGLHMLIGLILGFFVIMIPDITELISIMIPWFVLLFIFILLMIMAYKIFGASDDDVLSALKSSDKMIIYVIVIVGIIIVIASFSSVYGQKFLSGSGKTGDGTATGTGSTTTSDFSKNIGATFFHPKVIGLIFIFLVAAFTIALLATVPHT
ncbi:hypothetical protein COV19_03660 [Candidatus Woesearchaeota archaeon CG10_big_fil_rev_8_21_14_0_10_44_13]|nr:MAG: hypothetical protein COV19_03660 [Candidatus Woesearchaeota archaeon CG10_big_fil_rev_8_21_14_0_10_44_13]